MLKMSCILLFPFQFGMGTCRANYQNYSRAGMNVFLFVRDPAVGPLLFPLNSSAHPRAKPRNALVMF